VKIEIYCPACGEHVLDDDQTIAPGTIVECRNCGSAYSLEFKIVNRHSTKAEGPKP